MAIREIKYSQAITEGLLQAMDHDPKVIVMGQSAQDKVAMFNTHLPALEKYGTRFFEMPLSESMMTGLATGASLEGLKPVMTHHRDDFLLIPLDQIANHAAKWEYIHGTPVNWTIRAIVGRGWGQAAQHSQSLQATFAHFPGLEVVMPATPFDAKGLLISSIEEPKPVIIIEHRRLYNSLGKVPEDYYTVPIGKARVYKEGEDLTIVAISQMTEEANLAANALEQAGIKTEIIDPRTIRPLDHKTILESLHKTGRLIVCDTGWIEFGVSAEIAAIAAEESFFDLKAPVKRIGLPPCPTPASYELEKYYYPGVPEILKAALEILPEKKAKDLKDFATTDKAMSKFIGIF